MWIWIFSKHTLRALKFENLQKTLTQLEHWSNFFFKDIIQHQVASRCVFVSNVLWIVWDHMLLYCCKNLV